MRTHLVAWDAGIYRGVQLRGDRGLGVPKGASRGGDNLRDGSFSAATSRAENRIGSKCAVPIRPSNIN